MKLRPQWVGSGGRFDAPHVCPHADRRGKKGQPAEPPATVDQVGHEARDDALTATQPDDRPVPCAECGETFPGTQAATEH